MLGVWSGEFKLRCLNLLVANVGWGWALVVWMMKNLNCLVYLGRRIAMSLRKRGWMSFGM